MLGRAPAEALVECSSLAGRANLRCPIPGSGSSSSCMGSSGSLVPASRWHHPAESPLRDTMVAFSLRVCNRACMVNRRRSRSHCLWGSLSLSSSNNSSLSSGPLNKGRPWEVGLGIAERIHRACLWCLRQRLAPGMVVEVGAIQSGKEWEEWAVEVGSRRVLQG